MKPPDQVKRELVQQWVSLADEDLSTARDLLTTEPKHPRAATFHAQQASEKFLKAFLVERQSFA
ncbi:MAG: HEPN domain-containing protein [Planctomycetes bacterium]|nr:HEPN domain-containing protein [Planctomycetota bacterium]